MLIFSFVVQKLLILIRSHLFIFAFISSILGSFYWHVTNMIFFSSAMSNLLMNLSEAFLMSITLFLISSIYPVELLPECGCWKPECSGSSCDQKQSINHGLKSWPEATGESQQTYALQKGWPYALVCLEQQSLSHYHNTLFTVSTPSSVDVS